MQLGILPQYAGAKLILFYGTRKFLAIFLSLLPLF